MLTKAEILSASPVLDATDIAMWLTLIRANSVYRANKVLYPNVETVLTNASNTVKGRMLNATLIRLENLGVGEVTIVRGEEGIGFSQTAERDALVAYGLSIIYDSVYSIPALPNTTQLGIYGQTQVRQHSYPCGVYGLDTLCGFCGGPIGKDHVCGSMFDFGYFEYFRRGYGWW